MNKLFAAIIDKPPTLPETPADSSTVESILSFVFGTLGAIAFLVMVIAALQYVTSAGDPSKTAKARNTIVYAAIGLAIAGSAFIIVQLVIGSLL